MRRGGFSNEKPYAPEEISGNVKVLHPFCEATSKERR